MGYETILKHPLKNNQKQFRSCVVVKCDYVKTKICITPPANDSNKNYILLDYIIAVSLTYALIR